MKNPEKRNRHQLDAWSRKGGVHDDQDLKTNARKLRRMVKDEIDAAFEEYEELIEDEICWNDFDYLEEARDQERGWWQEQVEEYEGSEPFEEGYEEEGDQ